MATSAAPVLASSIWEALEKTEGDDVEVKRPQTLSLGVKSVDTVLEGGFEYGAVHAITSEPDQATKEVVQALIVSHLLSSSRASATIIDSTLSFDVRQLFGTLQATLGQGEDVKQTALKALDRLKIMKVFDHLGMSEAVAELRETIANRPTVISDPPAKKVSKSTIEDSEDEEDLMASPPPPKISNPPTETDEKTGALVIIDNISQVISPLIKNNYAQGQALLSSFMRSLGHLTREYNICTVVLANASNKSAEKEEITSMFESCTYRPALGVGFGYLVDVHIYLHSIPIKKPEKEIKRLDMANVLEVVQDNHGPRYGRWAAFVCGADGRLGEVP